MTFPWLKKTTNEKIIEENLKLFDETQKSNVPKASKASASCIIRNNISGNSNICSVSSNSSQSSSPFTITSSNAIVFSTENKNHDYFENKFTKEELQIIYEALDQFYDNQQFGDIFVKLNLPSSTYDLLQDSYEKIFNKISEIRNKIFDMIGIK